MNVEIGTEAAQFPEKEYIKGTFIAVNCESGSLYFKKMRRFSLKMLNHTF
jgi:hypothetical protein